MSILVHDDRSFPVEKLGFSVTYGPEEFSSPDIRRQSRKAVRSSMRAHREERGMAALTSPEITATESWFEYETPRRWWQRLLRRPGRVQASSAPYFVPGAARYVDHWEQRVVRAPAELHDRLRGAYRGQSALTVSTKGAGDAYRS